MEREAALPTAQSAQRLDRRCYPEDQSSVRQQRLPHCRILQESKGVNVQPMERSAFQHHGEDCTRSCERPGNESQHFTNIPHSLQQTQRQSVGVHVELWTPYSDVIRRKFPSRTDEEQSSMGRPESGVDDEYSRGAKEYQETVSQSRASETELQNKSLQQEQTTILQEPFFYFSEFKGTLPEFQLCGEGLHVPRMQIQPQMCQRQLRWESCLFELPSFYQSCDQRHQGKSQGMTAGPVQLKNQIQRVEVLPRSSSELVKDNADNYTRPKDQGGLAITSFYDGELQIYTGQSTGSLEIPVGRDRYGQNCGGPTPTLDSKRYRSGTKSGHHRGEDNNRLEQAKRFSSEREAATNQVQVRDVGYINRKDDQERDVDDNYRHTTCVPSCSDPQGGLGTPIIQNREQVLPGSLPFVWFKDSPGHLFNDYVSGERCSSLDVDSHNDGVPRRVLHAYGYQGGSREEVRSDHRDSRRPGIQNSFWEVSSTQSDCKVLRVNNKYTPDAVADPREEITGVNRNVRGGQIKTIANFETDREACWETNFLLQSSERWKNICIQNDRISECEKVESLGRISSIGEGTNQRRRLVAEDDYDVQWYCVNSGEPGPHVYYRRLPNWLRGLDYEQQLSSPPRILLSVPRTRRNLPHQCERTFSRINFSTPVGGTAVLEQTSNLPIGQRSNHQMALEREDESKYHTNMQRQSNGHTQRDLLPVNQVQHSSDSKTHCRGFQQISGCYQPQQMEASAGHYDVRSSGKPKLFLELELEAKQLMCKGLPLKQGCENMIRAFVRWGLNEGLEKDLIPTSELALFYYVVFLARTLTPGSIRSNITAIIGMNVRAGYLEYTEQFSKMCKVQRILKATDNALQDRIGKNKKQALDLDTTKDIGRYRLRLAKEEPASRTVCALTAFLIALWTGLRSDNLVPKKHDNFTERRQLHMDALIDEGSAYFGSLEEHKTRQKTKQPVVFSIPCICSYFKELCPYTALQQLTTANQVPPKALALSFISSTKSNHKNNNTKPKLNQLLYHSYLSKLWVVGERMGLKDKALTTHVPRITIATFGANAGLTHEQLLKLGNWLSSVSAEGYVRMKGKDLKTLQQQIIHHLDK